jgi:hypothetical protein
MPEIWLPYGSVEVAVSVKAENLAGLIEPTLQVISEETIEERLSRIEVKGQTCILFPKPSPVSTNILAQLIKSLSKRGNGHSPITVVTASESMHFIKKYLTEVQVNITEAEEPNEPLGVIDGIIVKSSRTMNESETCILLTDAGFDPLFGYAGGPSSLVRYLGGDVIAEAFRRRKGDRPTPGVTSDTSTFAEDIAKMFSGLISVEVLPSPAGAADIVVGDLIGAHQSASKEVLDKCRLTIDGDIRAVMVSAGGYGFDSSLATSLRAIWNVLDALGDKGPVVLVAECGDGLGSEALRRHIAGRLDLDGLLRRGEYVGGMEDLLYAKTALRRYDVVLVSALPDHYSEMKVGFHPARKVSDALTYILSSFGPRTKVHLVPRGATTLLSKA